MPNKKICIVVTSLGKGGAERSSALLSKMLVDLGYNVHIVTVLNVLDYEYAGTLLNLGLLKDNNNTFLGRIHRLFYFKNYLKKHKFDLIIDNRTRPKIIKEILINILLYKNQNLIFVIRNSNLKRYFSNSVFWAKIIYKRARCFVAVSDEVLKKTKATFGYNNVNVIKNPVDIVQNNLDANSSINFKNDFILYYGRLEDDAKNISLLMLAYNVSTLPSKNIKLLILGDGKDLNMLKQKSENSQIIFKPFTKNPFPYIKQAKFTCLTSRYEGFPRVAIESLSVGTPMVSVDCPGVDEIIKNGYNGLLVENYNVDALAKAMNSFIFDETLYSTCKSNSKKSVERFSVDEIAQQWKKLIESLV